MKLFQRTLLSFVGVILSRPPSPARLLRRFSARCRPRTPRANSRRRRSQAYESFNAWKLAFWKDINELAENGRLLHLVESARLSPSDVYAVEEALRQGLAGSGAESVFVEDGFSGRGRFLYRDPHDRGAPDGSRLSVARAHPYIEIVSTPRGSGSWA